MFSINIGRRTHQIKQYNLIRISPSGGFVVHYKVSSLKMDAVSNFIGRLEFNYYFYLFNYICKTIINLIKLRNKRWKNDDWKTNDRFLYGNVAGKEKKLDDTQKICVNYCLIWFHWCMDFVWDFKGLICLSIWSDNNILNPATSMPKWWYISIQGLDRKIK